MFRADVVACMQRATTSPELMTACFVQHMFAWLGNDFFLQVPDSSLLSQHTYLALNGALCGLNDAQNSSFY